jgi:Uma2 family endonuclease
MAVATLPPLVSPEEYLALEREAETKSEYFNGHIYAMAGASHEHGLISHNCSRELGNQLKSRPCELFTADMRTKVDPTGLYTYPDIVIVCDEPQFEDAHHDTLLNPIVIIEILSSSTEAYDRGEKFAHYRKLDSLREYVLVSQDRVRVEQYVRQGEKWVLAELSGRDDVLQLESVDCEVSLREIYLKVEFPEKSAMRPS